MSENSLSGLTVRDLLASGFHFGHQTKRWNPKMKPYIFDKRNGIHIIDITQSIDLLEEALQFVQKTVLDGKSILFVGTKKQAQEVIKQAAVDSSMFYVTTRWLGGMLTNMQTIRKSIRRMEQIHTIAANNNGVLSQHKKEDSSMRRELDKLERNLSGIAGMREMPGAIFVVDTIREANAVKEANRLGIPVIAITDSNSDPDPIDYIIPGNDDSIRAIKLISDCVSKVAKNAHEEYARKAAEEHAKREAERAAERAKDEANGDRPRRDADRPRRGGDRPRRGGDRTGAAPSRSARDSAIAAAKKAVEAAAAATAPAPETAPEA